jgi:hypothetical protein
VRKKLGRLEDAEAMERQAIEVGERLYGAEAHQLAALRSGLASIFEAQRRFDAADAEWQAAIDIARNRLGKEAGPVLRLQRARDEARALRSAANASAPSGA